MAARSSSFVCAECDRTFDVVRSDAEAWDEAQAEFGPEMQRGDCTVVCTACYVAIMAAVHPRAVH